MQRFRGAQAHNRTEAEMKELTRVLRSFGVLTGDWLKELSGARHWDAPIFEAVLNDAVRRGLIRRLGKDLYELDDRPQATTRPAAR